MKLGLITGLAEFDMDALIKRIRAAGHGDDIDWAENIAPPASAEDFALEVIFVICNSGMKHTVARTIYEKVKGCLDNDIPVCAVFEHAGKVKAIETIWRDRATLYAEYKAAPDPLWYLGTLPWIGEITKYHCAKNFGLQVAKPDVHLQRLARTWGGTPQEICEALAKRTGLKVATVDTLLWRAAAVGILDTRTGELRRAA